MDARKIRLLLELRRQGIADTEVLGAIEKVPREAFVEEAFLDQAYEDIALPIGSGQTISQPFVVASMTAALEVGPRMKVLEIGTGSGYQAAVLAHLCRRLYTIERHRPLSDEAAARFKALRLSNVVMQVGDGGKGWPEQAPFDRIILTACAEAVPETLLDQLRDGGIMVLPVVDSGGRGQRLVRIRRDGDAMPQEDLMGVRFVPLVPGIASTAPPA